MEAKIYVYNGKLYFELGSRSALSVCVFVEKVSECLQCDNLTKNKMLSTLSLGNFCCLKTVPVALQLDSSKITPQLVQIE